MSLNLKPFGNKALNFLYNSDAFINILHGSVRSGKTIVAGYRFLEFVLRSDYNEFLISGKTRDTIERNVIRDFQEMVKSAGLKCKYNKFDGYLDISGGNRIWLIGFSDECSTEKVRGMTVGGWYADEITSAPKSTVEMAITRCSIKGAKMFWTMNPQSPYHYIYTDYITNDKLIDNGTIKIWHFTLEDNNHLSKEYIDNLKLVNSNSSLNYKRNILGEWVMAEGAIYDMFDETKHVYNNRKKAFNRCHSVNICCDYGVSTVTVFGVMGVEHTNRGNRYYLLDEFYYDAKDSVLQSDTDRCNTVYKFQVKYGLGRTSNVILPHDATSLKAALLKDQRIRMRVITYRPNTYRDISVIQDLMSNNMFKMHKGCVESIKQAQTYSWDLKAQERGEDKPLKLNDHCPDMWRGGILGVRSKKRRILA